MLHVLSGGLLSPCAYGVQIPWIGVTAKAGDGGRQPTKKVVKKTGAALDRAGDKIEDAAT